MAASERIFEVLHTVPDIQDPPAPEGHSMSFAAKWNSIMSHSSMRLAKRCCIDVSVHAMPGQRIALVGRSGARKIQLHQPDTALYGSQRRNRPHRQHRCEEGRQTDLRRHIALVYRIPSSLMAP